MASSSETMRLVELFELQSRQGPCQDRFRTGRPVVNRDLTGADPRWPRFAAVAVSEGFRAADALPMRLRSNTIGAFNLFRSTPDRSTTTTSPPPKRSPTSRPSPSSSTRPWSTSSSSTSSSPRR